MFINPIIDDAQWVEFKKERCSVLLLTVLHFDFGYRLRFYRYPLYFGYPLNFYFLYKSDKNRLLKDPTKYAYILDRRKMLRRFSHVRPIVCCNHYIVHNDVAKTLKFGLNIS